MVVPGEVSSVSLIRWLTSCINPGKGVRPDKEYQPSQQQQIRTMKVRTKTQTKTQTKMIPTKSVRARPLYDNILLLSQDGLPLARCGWRRATWYLRNDLATCLFKEGEEMKVQLKFRPKHKTKGLVGQFYLEKRSNMCVVCGGAGHRRKYVVPRRIRKLLPMVMKSHQSHDVLLLCTSCHDRSQRWDSLMDTSSSSPSTMVSSFLSSDGLLQLEIFWRKHFLQTMEPRYLPSMWSIHHQGERLWELARDKMVSPRVYKMATMGGQG